MPSEDESVDLAATAAAPPARPAASLRPFHVMAKPIGARCNLACTYCYYLEKTALLHPADPGAARMSDATLDVFVRDYIAAQPAGTEIVFAWQGGEPTLLGLNFFRRVVSLQKHYAAGRVVQNAFQTNGTLLDDAWAAFFRAERFLVGISFDGPKLLHDAYRVDRAERPTWDRVRAGLSALRRHAVQFNTLTVVNRRNCRHALEIYRFLVDAGSRHLQFIPLVERRPSPAEAARGLDHAAPPAAQTGLIAPDAVADAMAPECAAPGRYGEFLRTIFDHWVQHDVGRVYVQQFDSALSSWLGQGSAICVHQERCGRSLALEPDGSLYSCDHYVYPEYRLGHITATPLAELANGAAARRFGDAKAELPAACLACPVRFACHGDCPKHRFVSTGAGAPGLSYLCPDYLGFFRHIDPVMKTMVALLRAGRAPAEIMRRPVRV